MDLFASSWFLLFAVAVALLLAVRQGAQYLAFRKLLQREAANGEVIQFTDFPMARRVSLLVPVFICVGAAIYILVRPDTVNDPPAYLALIAILCVLFSSSFFTANMTQRLYYTKRGFFIKERYILFSELKTLRHGSSKADSVVLQDGNEYPIPRRQMEALESLQKKKVFHLSVHAK